MKFLKIFLTALLLLIGLAFYFGSDLYFYATKPLYRLHKEKIFTILKGETLKETAQKLSEEGLIKRPAKFLMVARIKKSDKQIRAGEYLLSPDMTPLEILSIFTSGRIFLRKLVIPEGYSLVQIAGVVKASGLGSSRKFLSIAKDKSFVKSLAIPADTCEGYLFPDTYHFPKGVTEKEIISAMVGHLRSVITPAWEKRARKLKLDLHQVLTLASIIEKETGASHERPLISSVFHNRLKKNMRLEADPTVIYGIPDFSGNITRKDLETMTPYNTYQIKGLPPGPIASPGKESIEAALYPESTEYVYFVAKNDTTHVFSTNYKDHSMAVRKYQLGQD